MDRVHGCYLGTNKDKKHAETESDLQVESIPETLVVNDFLLIILAWILDTSEVMQKGRRLIDVA